MSSRRAAAVVAGILMLIPACWAGLAALRLVRASWPVAAARSEPLVRAIIGERDLEPALRRAASLADRDFNHPLGLSEEIRAVASRDGWSDPMLLGAHGHLMEAARRAPSDAETRFHLSGIAYRLGNTEEADAQARAALRLAPLHRDIRLRVGRYFQSRYAQTRDDRHLRTAVAALRGRAEELTRVILGDPLLTLDQVQKAFTAARTPVEKQIHYLGESGRWDWAIEVARRADAGKDGKPALEAVVRARLAAYLISIDRADAAFPQVLMAHEQSPEAVKDDVLLGRAMLAAGRGDEGFAILDQALDRGVSVELVAAALSDEAVDGARRVAFWSAIVAEGRGGEAARLAWAGALLAVRNLEAAHGILQRLAAESREVGPEACYRLARAHREFGDGRVALKYAQRAVKLAPRNREYQRLLTALTRGAGK